MNDISAADAPPLSEKRVACFGRFMIDVPPGAEVGIADTDYRFGTVHTEQGAYEAMEFEQRMERREAEIKTGNAHNHFRYIKTLSGVKPVAFRIFLSDMEGIITSRINRFEAYALAGRTLFSMEKEGYGPDRIDGVLSRLQSDIISRLRARAPEEIPTDPGLCIRDGFISSDGSEQANERINIGLNFKHWPDLTLTIEGRAVAFEGHKTSCGATLIATAPNFGKS